MSLVDLLLIDAFVIVGSARVEWTTNRNWRQGKTGLFIAYHSNVAYLVLLFYKVGADKKYINETVGQVDLWKVIRVLFYLQTAEILFFVIDNLTRSTASLVEAAYLAGNCCQVLQLLFFIFVTTLTVFNNLHSDLAFRMLNSGCCAIVKC